MLQDLLSYRVPVVGLAAGLAFGLMDALNANPVAQRLDAVYRPIASPEQERLPVLAAADQEASAISTGDAGFYFTILTEDAVFMPPNSMPKSGEELREWPKTAHFKGLHIVRRLPDGSRKLSRHIWNRNPRPRRRDEQPVSTNARAASD